MRDATLPSLIADAYDPWMPAFEQLLPILVSDYDALPGNDPRKARLAGPVALLRDWNYRWNIASMPTSLAVFWGDTLWDEVAGKARARGVSTYEYMATEAGPKVRLAALSSAVERLEQDFGSWGTAWGEINRYQRNDGAIRQVFDDAKPSIPVPFTSARWGSLASFGAHRWPGTKRYYGTSGNSFVAAVEFGDQVSARAVTAGGESGDPASPHFNDQAERYSTGNLRQVYFRPEQLKGHTEKVYRVGGP